MNRLRPTLALVLALVLGLTTAGFGVARGHVPTFVAGKMVLCVGGAAITVWFDPDGQPVEQQHLCPDAAPAFAGQIVHFSDVAKPDRIARSVHTRLIAPFTLPVVERVLPPVRAPPISV